MGSIEYTARDGLPIDTLKFFWAPFLTNMTDVIERLPESDEIQDHVVVSVVYSATAH